MWSPLGLQLTTLDVVLLFLCFIVIVRAYVLSGSVVSDSVILWTIAGQAPLSIGFSRQEYLIRTQHIVILLTLAFTVQGCKAKSAKGKVHGLKSG